MFFVCFFYYTIIDTFYMIKNFNNFILFSHHQGQKLHGVSKTPDILKDYFINYLSNVESSSPRFIDLPFHKSPCDNLFSLYSANCHFPHKKINIGGDHSMAIGSLGYSVNKYPNVKTIWFDAHADINTYSSSPTGNLHGMPLSILTGIENNYDFPFLKYKLKPSNIMYVGLRDVDPYEQFIVDKYNIPVITSKDFNSDPHSALNNITDFISDSHFHLSFDVDCLDPLFIPCTGTPVPNGLHIETTKYVLEHLLKHKKLINMDLTEFNISENHFSKNDINLSLNNLFKIFL